MVYVEAEDEPHRMPVCVPAGCAPLYRMPQTKWTWRLTVEMTIYVTWILGSMVLGGLMPTLLHKPAKSVTGAWDVSRLGLPPSNLSFCPAKPNYNYAPPARGFPPPPLRINGSDFVDGWEGQRVQLRGASWFGFNNEGGMVDALWVGGSRADTDFHALVYQMRLLGFNAVRLPFTFTQLKNPGKGQVMQCSVAPRDAWAKRTVDPDQSQAPNTSAVPEEAVPLELQRWEKELCNTYVPGNDTTLSGERLLWTMQYFVASGFYVVLDYHPSASDPLPGDADAFARAWGETWSSIACLPNYASDLKGRLLLDLLNEPDAALGGRGIHWQSAGTTPGLDLLYLSAIDAIEDLTPGDALYMVQGSTAAHSEATPGGPRTVNAFGLTAGDGFVTDDDTIQNAGLSNPRPFFTKLLGRPAASRTALAPHVFPPEISSTKLNGTTPAGGKELFEKLAASWGGLARSGFCSEGSCHRFPVVIGEMGSKLESKEDAAFFTDLALFVTASGELSDKTAPIAGWFWWSFNPNSALTGGLIAPNGTAFSWTKLRLLVSGFGLRPWYLDPTAFSDAEAKARAESQKRREAVDKEVVAAAAAAGRGPIAAPPPAQERRPPPDRPDDLGAGGSGGPAFTPTKRARAPAPPPAPPLPPATTPSEFKPGPPIALPPPSEDDIVYLPPAGPIIPLPPGRAPAPEQQGIALPQPAAPAAAGGDQGPAPAAPADGGGNLVTSGSDTGAPAVGAAQQEQVAAAKPAAAPAGSEPGPAPAPVAPAPEPAPGETVPVRLLQGPVPTADALQQATPAGTPAAQGAGSGDGSAAAEGTGVAAGGRMLSAGSPGPAGATVGSRLPLPEPFSPPPPPVTTPEPQAVPSAWRNIMETLFGA